MADETPSGVDPQVTENPNPPAPAKDNVVLQFLNGWETLMEYKGREGSITTVAKWLGKNLSQHATLTAAVVLVLHWTVGPEGFQGFLEFMNEAYPIALKTFMDGLEATTACPVVDMPVDPAIQ